MNSLSKLDLRDCAEPLPLPNVLITTGRIGITNTNPKHRLDWVFYDHEYKHVGTLSINDDNQMHFEGDADASARAFFKILTGLNANPILPLKDSAEG